MYYLIANPASRSGNSGEEVRKLQLVLDVQKKESRVCYTEYAGHARKMAEEISKSAAEAGEVADLVVMGGDGTINEVVSGIADFEAVRLGIVPVGSGNDMARGLGLPENPQIYARIAEGATQRTIDLGRVHYESAEGEIARGHSAEVPEDQYFAVSMGIGFDAAVCEEVNVSTAKSTLNKVHMGKMAYGAIALKQILSSGNASCDITTEDGQKRHFDKILMACAMNLKYQGGGYLFAPDADPSDGLLNVNVIGNLPRLKAMMAFPKVSKGTHYAVKGVYHFTARKLTIRTGEPLWVHTDGEVARKADAVTVEILPQKLRLLV